MFGNRIKELREEQSLLQRHVAAELDMDTPMLSKIERGERNAKREQVVQLAKLFRVKEDELIALWLADQVLNIVADDKMGLQALNTALKEMKH